jgi:hypothetical protein
MTKSRKRSPRHLSDTALILLGRAADRDDSMLLPYPASLRTRGEALAKVLTSLLAQGLIEEVPVKQDEEAWRSYDDGRYGLRITKAGLKAIGVPALESGLEVAPQDDQPPAVPTATPDPKPARPGSKLARLIELLMQPDGQTIDDLSKELGWLPHTTRAVVSRLQKSGHVVTRTKNEAGQSVYHVEPAASDQDA